ncbi:hypothetical protein M8542_30870 [Amycolatopsis sp. OK19-0408]|uniref:Uncharacterized protein n=1 Tax=Amycolatopsis iheyensis TaxID=2945988 RepID=A0A9X2SNM8_9PSEU|nr:hypothetical protein [Amycolatopsis iheyensis]MCR6487241.1 hypothetical protein [Amycolatopsis iheyensis]
MRWTVLYARSRHLPAAFAALVACPAGIRLLAGGDWALPHALLALTAAIAVAAIGLSGQDPDLDRTAALPWRPRRFVHLLSVGVAAAGAVLVVQLGAVPVSLILRDAAGLLGLAGLAATIAGGQFGWTLPVGWCAVALFVPRDGTTAAGVAAWVLQPVGAGVAMWTAVVLAVAGTASYTVFGARR